MTTQQQLANAEQRIAELMCELEETVAETQALKARLARIEREAKYDS